MGLPRQGKRNIRAAQPTSPSGIPRRLPLETQTLYAELLEHLRGADFLRSFASLSGGFALREQRNDHYWYFRTSEGLGATPQEFYIGPDDQNTRSLIKAYQEGRENAKGNVERITRLAAMLRSGGITLTDASSAKIIKGFANAGVFHLGGVLVGTHAYASIGNALGVVWQTGLQTQDVDFGALATPHVGIGVPRIPPFLASVPKAIEALEMGFVPNIRLHVASKTTSYVVPGKDWRIDLVTAPQGRDRANPVEIPRLGAFAEPLEFMDYALEKTMDAAIIGATGILVKVPEPARYAIHKLLVASNRDARFAAKAEKDRLQAFQLLSLLEQDRPGDILLAAEAALERGPGWRRRLREQAERMVGPVQELEDMLR